MTDYDMSENSPAGAVLSGNSNNNFVIVLSVLGLIAMTIYAVDAYRMINKAKQDAAYEKQKRIEAEIKTASLDQKLRYLRLNRDQSRYSERTADRQKTASQRSEQRERERKASTPAYTYQPATRSQKPASQQAYRSAKKAYRPKTVMYPKYSHAVKLRSSSKIRKLPDNRLTSNAPIFGRFEGPLHRPTHCSENYERDLGLHKECYVKTFADDRLYFSKIDKHAFDRFNSRRGYIQCNYNKKYGIMQDCKVWRFNQG